jgi:glucokinase
LDWFENSEFLSAFNAKGKMTDLMQRFPVYVIKHPQVGLLGAKTLAKQSIV